MTDYLVFTVEKFRIGDGDEIDGSVGYHCELIPSGENRSNIKNVEVGINLPRYYADSDPHRLFAKIASLYLIGDSIRTVPEREISDSFSREVHGWGRVELKQPLSHDEMRILAGQVLEKLVKK